MNDGLEDFVRRNRGDFDDREPSPAVWRGIETSMGFTAPAWRKQMMLWRAAAVFFMALSASLLIFYAVTNRQSNLAMKEFSDVEAFYTQQISHKVELIDELNETDGLNGFTHDFHQLEAMYLVLKEEMKMRPSKKVKDALVLNLLVRIDLLNQQLHRLEEQKDTGEKKADKGQRST